MICKILFFFYFELYSRLSKEVPMVSSGLLKIVDMVWWNLLFNYNAFIFLTFKYSFPSVTRSACLDSYEPIAIHLWTKVSPLSKERQQYRSASIRCQPLSSNRWSLVLQGALHYVCLITISTLAHFGFSSHRIVSRHDQPIPIPTSAYWFFPR